MVLQFCSFFKLLILILSFSNLKNLCFPTAKQIFNITTPILLIILLLNSCSFNNNIRSNFIYVFIFLYYIYYFVGLDFHTQHCFLMEGIISLGSFKGKFTRLIVLFKDQLRGQNFKLLVSKQKP